MKHFLIAFTAILSIVFVRSTITDALSNPLSFSPEDSILKGDDENISFPLSDNKETLVSQDEMNMDDLFGSEQVFPFEPGFS